MATNLHALIRQRTIDRCLRDRSTSWTWKSLAEECELMLNDEMGIDTTLSRRTIMYDIKHMKDGILGYHAPIVYNRDRKSYEYSNEKFSISQAPVSPKTLEELDQVLLILRQFSSQEKLEGMGSVIAKLEHGLNIHRDGKTEALIHFEQGLNAPGQKWLDILYRHIKRKECLNISYRAFDKDITHHMLSPYILKEYNNRWYVFGFNHQDEYIQNLALDRILEVRTSLRSFERVSGFDPDVLFNDIVGVTLPDKGKVVRVLIEAFGKQAKYIDTKPLHKSQRIVKKKKKSIVFSYNLIPNFELESKLLTYADLVEVIEPIDLRDKIAARLIAAAINYANQFKAAGKKKKSAGNSSKKNKGVGSKKKKKGRSSLKKEGDDSVKKKKRRGAALKKVQREAMDKRKGGEKKIRDKKRKKNTRKEL